MPAKAESIETPPCAPPGYSALKASSADVLLELTISNKCGQAFRWRSVQVWEPRLPPAAVTTSSWSSAVKKEPEDSGVESQALSKPELEEQTEWSLCLHDRVVLVRQDIDRGYIYHRTLVPQTGRPEGALDAISAEPDSSLSQETNEWLADYLSLRVPVTELTAYWSSRDPIFAKQAPRFMGLRMLRQDPWECLCAFICSSNNNISRIGQMVSKLCTEFTPPMLELTYPSPPVSSDPEDSEAEAGASDLNLLMVYHPFPSAARLAGEGVEQKLRELGFGYRAKYIATTAQMLCAAHPQSDEADAPLPPRSLSNYDILESSRLTMDGILPRPVASLIPDADSRPRVKRRRTVATDKSVSDEVSLSSHSVTSYLASLRNMPYIEARQELIKLPGIGPKVADCILLMSMDQPSSIPVDRHVFNFAERWYGLRGASGRGRKGYEDVANKLRDVWGGWAGWAHSVLFTAELRAFAKFEQPSMVKKEEANGKESNLDQEADAKATTASGTRRIVKPDLAHTYSAPAGLNISVSHQNRTTIPFPASVNTEVKAKRKVETGASAKAFVDVSFADRVKGRRRLQ